MPILASLNAKNRSKSPFSIGMLFSIISDLTDVGHLRVAHRLMFPTGNAETSALGEAV